MLGHSAYGLGVAVLELGVVVVVYERGIGGGILRIRLPDWIYVCAVGTVCRESRSSVYELSWLFMIQGLRCVSLALSCNL